MSDELAADWLESVAALAEARLANLTWRELSPAGRILRYGANYEVDRAWVKDARIEDGVVHLDVVLRLRPSLDDIVVTVKVP